MNQGECQTSSPGVRSNEFYKPRGDGAGGAGVVPCNARDAKGAILRVSDIRVNMVVEDVRIEGSSEARRRVVSGTQPDPNPYESPLRHAISAASLQPAALSCFRVKGIF